MSNTDTVIETAPEAPAVPQHTASDRREWLKANGYVVGMRGRISATHNKAYDVAHGLV